MQENNRLKILKSLGMFLFSTVACPIIIIGFYPLLDGNF